MCRLCPWALLISMLGLGVGCGTQLEKQGAHVSKSFTNSLGMNFVLVAPGEFKMGTDGALPNPVCSQASPAHQVRLTKPYYLAAHEVTQGQYRTVMGSMYDHPIPPFFSDAGGGNQLVHDLDTDALPIDNVTWVFASEFCRKLSDLPAEKQAGRSYRLPTEAEWEFACRAGATTPFAFGDKLDLSSANFNAAAGAGGEKPLGRVTQVGRYPPNAWGFFDMHGNVWEWCADGMREYSTAGITDPVGPEELYRVLKGGAWDMPASYCRADYRASGLAGYVFVGFRVLCETGKSVAKSP